MKSSGRNIIFQVISMVGSICISCLLLSLCPHYLVEVNAKERNPVKVSAGVSEHAEVKARVKNPVEVSVRMNDPVKVNTTGNSQGMDEAGDISDEMLEEMDFYDINRNIQKMIPGEKIKFSELVMKILKGEEKLNIELIKETVRNGTIGSLEELKKTAMRFISLGIMAALFSGFGHLFKNHQIVDISYYFVYMLFTLLLLITFKDAVGIADTMLEQTVLFMKLLVPTFSMAVGFTSATMTALVFQQFMLLIITLVEVVLSMILLPMTSVYVFLSMMNGMGEENRFAILIELMHKSIENSLKIMIIGMSGMSFLQSMITPVIDNVKTAAMQKTIAAIPGIGRIADSLSEVVLGSAILIKNSVGVAFLILLITICAVPLVRIFLLALVVKISAAFIGIITDKGMSRCANQVGDGTFLILKIAATAVAMIVITVAIIIQATNKGM